MSERESFARKYRPHSLENYVGQERVKNSIEKLLSGSRFPQTMLLSGASGCGKTTLARIIARELKCNKGVSGRACGKCDLCRGLEQWIRTGDNKTTLSVVERNIAADSTKESFIQLIEDIKAYSPTRKVYILDECHKASDGAQNALLKVLEEPPEDVYIILCTTEPEALKATIRNRCVQKYEIQKPSDSELVEYLGGICEEESLPYDKRGLNFIIAKANSTIRDCLNLLDNLVGDGVSAKYTDVSEHFGSIQVDEIMLFWKALVERDIFNYTKQLWELKQRYGVELFHKEMLNFVRDGIYLLNGVQVELGCDKKEYKRMFSKYTMEELGYLLKRLLGFQRGELELEYMLFGYEGFVKMGKGLDKVGEENALKASNDEKQEQQDLEAKEELKSEGFFDELGDDFLTTLDKVK